MTMIVLVGWNGVGRRTEVMGPEELYTGWEPLIFVL